MTYSIVALDAATGDLGVATQSKFLAVGAVVPWARAGVGAVATQAYANVGWGLAALDRLAAGGGAISAQAALAGLVAADDMIAVNSGSNWPRSGVAIARSTRGSAMVGPGPSRIRAPGRRSPVIGAS